MTGKLSSSCCIFLYLQCVCVIFHYFENLAKKRKKKKRKIPSPLLLFCTCKQ